MLCEDARRALPGSGMDDNPQLREHTRACAECAKVEAAYAADAAALKTYAADRELPSVMAGFSDSLMARLAEEPAVMAEPEGKVLRPNFSFTLIVAVAAGLLLTASLGLILSSPNSGRGPEFATTTPPKVTPTTPPLADASDANTPADALPAPRRHERAPTPLRVRNPRGIVPVDGGNRSDMGRGNLMNVLQDLQRVFPNWDPSGMDRRVPRLKPGEREVRF